MSGKWITSNGRTAHAMAASGTAPLCGRTLGTGTEAADTVARCKTCTRLAAAQLAAAVPTAAEAAHATEAERRATVAARRAALAAMPTAERAAEAERTAALGAISPEAEAEAAALGAAWIAANPQEWAAIQERTESLRARSAAERAAAPTTEAGAVLAAVAAAPVTEAAPSAAALAALRAEAEAPRPPLRDPLARIIRARAAERPLRHASAAATAARMPRRAARTYSATAPAGRAVRDAITEAALRSGATMPTALCAACGRVHGERTGGISGAAMMRGDYSQCLYCALCGEREHTGRYCTPTGAAKLAASAQLAAQLAATEAARIAAGNIYPSDLFADGATAPVAVEAWRSWASPEAGATGGEPVLWAAVLGERWASFTNPLAAVKRAERAALATAERAARIRARFWQSTLVLTSAPEACEWAAPSAVGAVLWSTIRERTVDAAETRECESWECVVNGEHGPECAMTRPLAALDQRGAGFQRWALGKLGKLSGNAHGRITGDYARVHTIREDVLQHGRVLAFVRLAQLAADTTAEACGGACGDTACATAAADIRAAWAEIDGVLTVGFHTVHTVACGKCKPCIGKRGVTRCEKPRTEAGFTSNGAVIGGSLITAAGAVLRADKAQGVEWHSPLATEHGFTEAEAAGYRAATEPVHGATAAALTDMRAAIATARLAGAPVIAANGGVSVPVGNVLAVRRGFAATERGRAAARAQLAAEAGGGGVIRTGAARITTLGTGAPRPERRSGLKHGAAVTVHPVLISGTHDPRTAPRMK